MLCPACQTEAKYVQGVSKVSGTPWQGWECVSGCKNPQDPRYALRTFIPSPKAPQTALGGPRKAPVASQDPVLAVLREISYSLKSISGALVNISTKINLKDDPMENVGLEEPRGTG